MKIPFSKIKPFLRFVRFLNIDSTSKFVPVTPYDARLFFVLDGNGIIMADGKTYTLKKHSVIFINSGVRYHHIIPDRFVSYLAINFDFTYEHSDKSIPIPPEPDESYNKDNIVEHIRFCDIPEFDDVLLIPSMASIKNKLIAMETEFSKKDSLYELSLSSSLISVLIQMTRHLLSHRLSSHNTDLSGEIMNFIQENFNQNLSNKKLGEMFHYHPVYISNIIKLNTGYPLHQFLKNIRITNAAQMLTTTNKSIYEIALDCGFYDASHLIRSFKEIIGITPQQYRDTGQ
ncbi:MAG: helix-turn-helix transcriptional regulator [Clostridia bacterium]|nr:helix-turn-helix transcriptional regulator [Clostridia bacterium]